VLIESESIATGPGIARLICRARPAKSVPPMCLSLGSVLSPLSPRWDLLFVTGTKPAKLKKIQKIKNAGSPEASPRPRRPSNTDNSTCAQFVIAPPSKLIAIPPGRGIGLPGRVGRRRLGREELRLVLLWGYLACDLMRGGAQRCGWLCLGTHINTGDFAVRYICARRCGRLRMD